MIKRARQSRTPLIPSRAADHRHTLVIERVGHAGGLAGFSLKKLVRGATNIVKGGLKVLSNPIGAIKNPHKAWETAMKPVERIVSYSVKGVSSDLTKFSDRAKKDLGNLANHITGANPTNFFGKLIHKSIDGVGTGIKQTAANTTGLIPGEAGKAGRKYTFGGGFAKDFRSDTGMTLSNAAKIVAGVLTVVFPVAGLVLGAALTARDIAMAKRATKEQKRDYDNAVSTAYTEYTGAVSGTGFAPVSREAFAGWIAGGATGDIPLGAAENPAAIMDTAEKWSASNPEEAANALKKSDGGGTILMLATAYLATKG